MKNWLNFKVTVFLISILLQIYACHTEKREDEKFQILIKEVIDKYMEKYPFNLTYIGGAEYPSYNLTFHLYKGDTLVNMDLANFVTYDIIFDEIVQKENKKATLDGVFWITNRIPVAFHNIHLYDRRLKKKLKKTPDSLLYHSGIIYDSKQKRMDFIFKNNKFIPINLKEYYKKKNL